MTEKPKRKPKNKDASIDERIKSHLYDGEEIIWCARTQKHYLRFSEVISIKMMQGLVGLYMMFLGIAFFLDFQLFSAFAGSLLCLPIILFLMRDSVASYLTFLGVSLLLTLQLVGGFTIILFCLSILSFVVLRVYIYTKTQHYLDHVNVITNYRVMVYDAIKQDIVFAFAHDDIHKFWVREYSLDRGNITVNQRSNVNVKYRASLTYPLKFTLRGIDNLGHVVQLLRSRLDIEPEYVQSYRKAKNE